jgi:hypothetical protein
LSGSTKPSPENDGLASLFTRMILHATAYKGDPRDRAFKSSTAEAVRTKKRALHFFK